MSLKDREHIRAEATQKARQDTENEAQIGQRLREWRSRTIWLGVAVVLCVGAIAPFTEGLPLHQYAGHMTKALVYLAMCLLVAFMYAAGTTYIVWSYLRSIRAIHKKFSPPGSKYRTGK